MNDEYKFLAMNIVNQLYDLAEVPVDKRQAVNHQADEFVRELLQNRCPFIFPYFEKQDELIQLITFFGRKVTPQIIDEIESEYSEDVIDRCLKVGYIRRYYPHQCILTKIKRIKGYYELTRLGAELYFQSNNHGH